MDKGIKELIADIRLKHGTGDVYAPILRWDEFEMLAAALEQTRMQSSKWLEAYHKAVSVGARYEERIAELESAPNGMMQLSNELAEMKQTVSRLRGERDTMLRDRLNNMESRPLCVKPNDAMREVAALCVKLPELAHIHTNWSGEYMLKSDVIEAIRAAGGTVEGSE